MKPLIVAASVTVCVAGAGVQGLAPEDIAAAIAQGQAGKTLQKSCKASGENGFDITAEGPVGRVMRAAREAKRLNRPFTAADVTEAMDAAVVTVSARRDPTLRTPTTEYVTPGTSKPLDYRTDFVLRSKPSGSDKPIVLKPVEPVIFDVQNAPGNRVAWKEGGGQPRDTRTVAFPGSDMIASFDLAAFKAIPHRDIEVVVFMTDTGEHRCKISENERKALR